MAAMADPPCDNIDGHEESLYQNAVSALLSPLHQATTPVKIRAAAARRRNTLRDMHTYLHRLGLNLNGDDGDHPTNTTTKPEVDPRRKGAGVAAAANVPSLIIHVTGTKGKGSTLSLCESILRNAHGLTTGMFTSPHLVSMRERIRIDGKPVSKEVFGRVYWRVRRQLQQFDTESNDDNDVVDGDDGLPPLPVLPGYFRMLTLMAMYTFCHYENPKIDVILLEVGMGGRYDATNVFTEESPPQPSSRMLIRGVTLIDYDHTRVLGSTLEQIAWEKGGIFVRDKLADIGMNDGGYDKFPAGDTTEHEHLSSSLSSSPSVVFASGNNTPEVLSVLRHIANSNDCHLKIVNDSCVETFPCIGLQGEHQRSNAALALSMCGYAMNSYNGRCHPSLSLSLPSQEEMQAALATTFWPGRCHTVSLPCATSDNDSVAMNLRCDGAHTPISINACIDWFRQVSSSPSNAASTSRVLVFNCSHERNPIPLLLSLCESNLFDSVYFCRADFERPSAVPKRLEEGWTKQPLEIANDDDRMLTLEGMCEALTTAKLPSRYDESSSIILDPTKLSASTWQETLGNIWRVLDMHQRYCGGGHSSVQPSMKVTIGMNVKDALSSIQNDVLSVNNNNVAGEDAAVRSKRTLIETCVTGSLYIVGSALEAAGWEEDEASGNVV